MGPTRPFLLMYVFHDMRHRFPQVDSGQLTPEIWGVTCSIEDVEIWALVHSLKMT